MGAAVVVGVITNLLVTVSFVGDNFINTVLLCANGESCGSFRVFWGTIFIASFSCLIVLVSNIIWWRNTVKKISIITPNGDLENLEISIENKSKKDLLEVNYFPRFIKDKTWSSRLNTTRDLDNYVFRVKHSKIRQETKVREILAESSVYEGVDYPLTKFLIGEKGYFCKNYFPYEVNNNTQKEMGDLYIAIFEIVVELTGKIGNGEISKLYLGKFSHTLTVYKYERKKYRNSSRLVKCKPKYVSNIQWLDFKECSIKQLEKIKKENQDRENDKNAKAEIQTKDDLMNELFVKNGGV